MAFVKMKDLTGKEIKIPSGAVDSYKNLGFYPADEFEEELEEETQGSDDKMTEEEIFVEEISKKPIASWNKEEVKRYASIYEIDLTGTKTINEAKDIIKAFMDNAE